MESRFLRSLTVTKVDMDKLPYYAESTIQLSPDGKSYCGNSDLFSKVGGEVRNIPDDEFKKQAEFYKHLFD